jgi:hypothetical protein
VRCRQVLFFVSGHLEKTQQNYGFVAINRFRYCCRSRSVPANRCTNQFTGMAVLGG